MGWSAFWLCQRVFLLRQPTIPGCFSLGRFSVRRGLAALPSWDDFLLWCQRHKSRKFVKSWLSPRSMWSTSVPLSVHRSPFFIRASHWVLARVITTLRRVDQLEGRWSARLDPTQGVFSDIYLVGGGYRCRVHFQLYHKKSSK